MGSTDVKIARQYYGGNDVHQVATALAKAEGHHVVVWLKKGGHWEEDRLGCCRRPEDVKGYLSSQYSVGTEVVYDDGALAWQDAQKEVASRGGSPVSATPPPSDDSALAKLLGDLRTNPRSVPLHLEIAKVYNDQQHSEKTIEYCMRALKIDPNNPLALTLLGAAHTRRGQWDKAVASLLKALALDPDSEWAYELLGRLVLEAVLNVSPEQLKAVLSSPVYTIHYGPIVINRQLEAGIRYYQKGCTEKRQYLRVYYRMGMLYHYADNPEKLQERIASAACGGYAPAQEWLQELSIPPKA